MDFTLEFTRTFIPAFQADRGYWTRYDALSQDGVTGIVVETCMRGFQLGGGSQIVYVSCRFDPEAFPVEVYGIVYGDDEFERRLDAHIRRVLGAPDTLGHITYTEHGMQGDDFISLEAPRAWAAWLAGLSRHVRLELANYPEIQSFEMVTTDF